MTTDTGTFDVRIFEHDKARAKVALLESLLDDALNELCEAELSLPVWEDYLFHDILFADSEVYPDLQPMMGPEEYIELPF